MAPNPLRAAARFLRGDDLPHRQTPPLQEAALPPGTAEQKLYYNPQWISLAPSMLNYTGPLVHGPGASAYYAGLGQSPIASNSAVYACLAVIVKAYWAAPLRVFRKTDDGDEEWLDDHPFQELADDPHEGLTKREVDFWRLFAVHIHGNAYFRKVRTGAGNPRFVQLISPLKIAPVTTDADRARGVFISHYAHEYEPGKYEDIPTEDVIHFRLGVDDADHRLGMSPLQRVIREVCTDAEAMAFTESLLRNMGAVGLVVTLPPNVPMTREEAEDLRQRIDDKFANEGRGRTSVLTNGATMTQTGFSPQAMSLKDIHRIPEERIAAVLGVHPMVAGLGAGLERSTFSNYAEARDALYEQTIVPLYEADAATWEKHVLRPDFDTDKAVHVRYDTTDVAALQDDLNEVYVRLSLAVEKKWIKRNEARSEVGLPPVEGWDEEDEAPPPVPVLPPPSGDDGEDDAGAPPEARMRRVLAQRKAMALAAIPGMLDALHELATPALEADLDAYFAGQRARVNGRLHEGG
jgi:HK97 family phage portal protein